MEQVSELVDLWLMEKLNLLVLMDQSLMATRLILDQAMKRMKLYKTEEGRAMLKLQEGDTHHGGGCGNCGGDK